MNLTRLSIQRPIVLLMLLAALMVLGWKARLGLPAELDPRVEIPVVNISAVFPGASPEEVELRLTRPLEDAVATVGNVTNISSRSVENLSIVTVRLKLGTDINAAAADLRARVDAARPLLPEEVEAPQVTKFDYNARPVMVLGVVGDGAPEALRALVDETIKPRLSRVPGLGGVAVVGGRTREIQVRVDPDRLAQYGISLTELLRPVGAASRSVPAGNLVQGRSDISVRVVGEFRSLADLAATPLPPAPDRRPSAAYMDRNPGVQPSLRLGDLAVIRDTTVEPEQITRIGRRDSIALIITRVADANSVEVADGVKEALKELAGDLPSGIRLTILQDHSQAVADALEDINATLILGALLAVLVVYLFLHSVKDTLIVACSIPTSIIVTFIVMYFAGFSLNQMTMLALSLSVGILVDDSILVLECIHRHRAMGKEPEAAALDGRQEIGLADAANTFVDVVVFVPIAFMGGIVGQFFRQFGITIAAATLVSLYVSFTLTPMLAARLLRKGEGSHESHNGFARWFEARYARVENRYRRVLEAALRHRWTVFCLGFGSLAAVGAVAWQAIGFDFTPSVDRGQVTVELELPPGTSLEVTNRVLSRVEREAGQLPEVDPDRMLASAGEILGGFGSLPDRGTHLGQLTLMLREKQGFVERLLHPRGEPGRRMRTDEQVAADLRRRLEAPALFRMFSGAAVTVAAARGLTGARAPVEIDLYGADLRELEQVAAEATRRLAQSPVLRNVNSSFRRGDPELQVVLNRERAEELLVSPAELAGVLRTAVAGNTDYRLREGDRSLPIRLQLARGNGESRAVGPDELENLLLTYRGPTPVYVADVADFRLGTGPTRILRSNRTRNVLLSAQVREGVALGAAQTAADKALEDMHWGGVRQEWGGDVSDMAESAGLMTGALLLAIALSYMLMAALFNSLLSPLVIMMSVPMALVGGLLGLIVTGATMNIVSMIGIVMLVGLVSKNAILLVDYTNTLRHSGLTREEALIRAGPVRLRPILMTTLSTVCAMTPVALQIGRASEMRAPMAIVVIGGLILSTVLTLIVIPVMYTFFDDLTGLLVGARKASTGARALSRRRPQTSSPVPPLPE